MCCWELGTNSLKSIEKRPGDGGACSLDGLKERLAGFSRDLVLGRGGQNGKYVVRGCAVCLAPLCGYPLAGLAVARSAGGTNSWCGSEALGTNSLTSAPDLQGEGGGGR